MWHISINQVFLMLKLLEIRDNAEKMDIRCERINCDSTGETFSLYMEALDKITEMMDAYSAFLEHDVKKIQASVCEIKQADTQMAERWSSYGTGGDE